MDKWMAKRIASILITLYVFSLLTGGFTFFIYYSAMIMYSIPYVFLVPDLLAGVISLIVLAKIYMTYNTRTGSPILLGIMEAFIIATAIMLPATGFILPIIVAIMYMALSGSDDLSAFIIALAFLTFMLIPAGVMGYHGPVASSAHISRTLLSEPINVYGAYRLIPLYTAYAYGLDRIQSPTHTLDLNDSYIYYNGETPVYNWIIEPEGFINSLAKKPLGVVFVEGDKYPPVVRIIKHPMKYSLEKRYFKLLYFDTLARQAMLHSLGGKPLLHENIEVVYKGEILVIIPVVKWDRGGTWNLEVPWKYLVFHENGSIEEVPCKKALRDPRFKGVPLLPEETAREWVETYAYHVGVSEYYFHHNSYVIRNVGGNPQPYLTVGSDGRLYWVFVAEPMGKTYSVKYIIYVPTDTCKPTLEVYKPGRAMMGVSKVVSYVESAHPTYDWGKLRVVEPVPTIIDGRIYWTVKIITKDYRGLVSIDLVDASTSRVQSIKVSGKGSITGEEILQRIIQASTGNITGNTTAPTSNNTSVIEELHRLKEEINATIQKLHELYREVETLEKQLSNTTG